MFFWGLIYQGAEIAPVFSSRSLNRQDLAFLRVIGKILGWQESDSRGETLPVERIP